VSAKKVVSSGGVIFRNANGDFEVALVSRRNIWCLPKGLIEANETAEEAALREVQEETGLKGEIVSKIGEVSYSFFRKQRYFKTVHFYLLRFVGGSMEAHDSEMERVKWFPIADAIKVLTYVNEKKIMNKASEILKNLSNT
jgi:8-oxo-dGTP pyrophosphatase MutT (NUDIX family)